MYDPRDIDFSPARRSGELDDLPDYFALSFAGKIGTGGLRGDLRGLTDDHYREILAHTYGMISMVDAQVGRVMQSIEELSLLDDTIVVFMSDHGDLMGDHWLINKGPYLYRGLVRVPNIWRIPGCRDAGRQSPAMVSTVDFCPTILDLAGAPVADDIQGRSYRSVLDGSAQQTQDSVLVEFDESYIEARLRQLRTADWAITAHIERADGLLFDLRNDPNELHNLWDEPRCEGAKSELLAELHRRFGPPAPWTPGKTVHA